MQDSTSFLRPAPALLLSTILSKVPQHLRMNALTTASQGRLYMHVCVCASVTSTQYRRYNLAISSDLVKGFIFGRKPPKMAQAYSTGSDGTQTGVTANFQRIVLVMKVYDLMVSAPNCARANCSTGSWAPALHTSWPLNSPLAWPPEIHLLFLPGSQAHH